MSLWKITGWAVAIAAEILILAGVVAWEAKASPGAIDPHVPSPALGYCPGNEIRGGLFHNCDGRPFPDGTFWRVTNVPGVGFVLTCETAGGIAGPGGCEGNW